MEDTFDFMIDFQNITEVPMPEFIEDETSQEPECFVEIVQNGKKGYKCTHTDCGKTFRFKSEANRHLIIHQKDRPYSCSVSGCKKSFKRIESLEDHMKIHGGELPFSCDEPGCDRRFVSKPALRYHQLRHKNKREFKCDLEGCNKSFLTLAHLKQHQFSGLHNKLDIPEVAPSKLHKPELSPLDNTKISEPVIKPIEGLQWETKTQGQTVATPEEKAKDMYELLQNILAENRILKERLNEDQSAKLLPEEKEAQFSFDYADPMVFSTVVEPNNNDFDKFELNILEFLNEKGTSGF